MITSEDIDIRKAHEECHKADNMIGLIKSVHCVNLKIDIIHIGPSLFGRKKDE